MNARALTFAMGAIAFAATAGTPIPAAAPNCGLAAPPPEAGETGSHGVLIKVHPRRAAIGADYTGCQLTWVDQQGKWTVLSVLYFEAGELRAWRMPLDARMQYEVVCSFKNGRLVPRSPSECYVPAPQAIPTPSYAPGCIERAIKTGDVTNECVRSHDGR